MNCFCSFYRNKTFDFVVDLKAQVGLYPIQDQDVSQKVRDFFLTGEIIPNVPYSPLGRMVKLQYCQNLSPTAFKVPTLPGFILKTNDSTNSEEKGIGNSGITSGPYDNLLRPFYLEKLKRAAALLEIDLVLPKKYIVPLTKRADSISESSDLPHHFVVLSEEIPLMSLEDQVKHWEKLQKEGKLEERVRKICTLTKACGFIDPNLSNMGFTLEGRLTIIDSEPMGLFTLDPAGDSVAKMRNYGFHGLKQLQGSIARISKDLSLFFSPVIEQELASLDTPSLEIEKVRDVLFGKTTYNWAIILLSVLIFPALFLLIYACLNTAYQKIKSNPISLIPSLGCLLK